MKKDLIIGIVIGSCLTAAVGVAATSLTATSNPFPVQLNGNNVSIEGYNINNNTYFKLRDIADVVGGFSVGFNDNTIQLSKDGYTYTSALSVEDIVIAKFKEQFNVDPSTTTVTFNDVGDYYTVNAKQYIGDPDFPYSEWGCMVDKNTLEFYNFAN